MKNDIIYQLGSSATIRYATFFSDYILWKFGLPIKDILVFHIFKM